MNGIYLTRHSHAAAYLWYAGLGLIEVRRAEKGFEFEFDDPEGIGAELERDFWQDGQVTSAKKLLDANREVQREVYMLKTGVY